MCIWFFDGDKKYLMSMEIYEKFQNIKGTLMQIWKSSYMFLFT